MAYLLDDETKKRDADKREMITNALRAIDDWCKENVAGYYVKLDNAVSTNTGSYRISASSNGIGACGYGKFSSWYHVGEKGYDLMQLKVAEDIVYNWSRIKTAILNDIANQKSQMVYLQEFQV